MPATELRGGAMATAAAQVELLSVAQGFMSAAVLFACLDLDIFGNIGKEQTVAELAAAVGVPSDRLARLLSAAEALGLVERDDGEVIRISSKYNALLSPDMPEGSVLSWLAFVKRWYAPFGSLGEVIRGAGPAMLYESAESCREASLAMHDFASLRGSELVDLLDTSKCTSLLDVGCGPGTYSYMLGRRNPDLRLFLLDRADVLAVAREIRDRFDLRNEVRYVECDLREDEIDGSYDLVLVSNLLHTLSDADARSLVRRLHRVVNSGGSIVVQGQFLAEDGALPRWPAFVDLAALCFTGGRNHGPSEISRWLEEAGFIDIRHERMSVINSHSIVRGFRR